MLFGSGDFRMIGVILHLAYASILIGVGIFIGWLIFN